MYDNIIGMLNNYDLEIVKVTNLTNKKFILYTKDKILNYKIVSNSTKQDVLEDIIHIVSSDNPNWYIDIVEQKPSFKKGVEEIKTYLSYYCRRVNDIINDPARELMFTDNGVDYFNLFQNTKYVVEKPNEYKDWSTIYKVLSNLCGKDEDNYDWAINFLSCLYNNPTYRFATSIIFIGDKGSGKGMLSEALMKIYGRCTYRANSKDLTNNFNSQLFEGKVLLLANEIIDQRNKYQFSNDLKEFVTEKEISVEKKFSDRYMAKNYIKLILFSNSNQPISIEEDDRRYAVFKGRKIDIDYEERKKYWDDVDNYFTDQVEGFCYFLKNYKYDLSKVVSEPIMTTYKQDIIDVNKTDFKSIILDILKSNSYDYVKSTDGNYYLLYSLVYDQYFVKEGVRRIAKNKFSPKLKLENLNL